MAWVDPAADFLRARRQHELARLVSLLRREPDDSRLLRFDELVSVLGFRGEYDLGVRTIALRTVVGTVDKAHRVGGLHFVKDGHHRVSVAMATGEVMIDADVTEVLTRLPATSISPHSRGDHRADQAVPATGALA
jgi:hypothetical protein